MLIAVFGAVVIAGLIAGYWLWTVWLPFKADEAEHLETQRKASIFDQPLPPPRKQAGNASDAK